MRPWRLNADKDILATEDVFSLRFDLLIDAVEAQVKKVYVAIVFLNSRMDAVGGLEVQRVYVFAELEGQTKEGKSGRHAGVAAASMT